MPYTTQLQFFGQEEGCVRALRPTPKSNLTGLVYDYMLKDHLGNVRMVLTDEVVPPIIYQAVRHLQCRTRIGGFVNRTFYF